MSLPENETSSHSSSEENYSDGPCEYEVEYEEEMAADAEAAIDTDEDAGPHQYDPIADEAFAATYEQEMEQRGEEEQRLIRRFESREPIEFW